MATARSFWWRRNWLDCVVLLDGAGYDVAKATQADRSAGLYLRAFGDDPAVWADASPANHVGEGPLPSRVLVVVQGGEGRVATVRSFADQLATAGADAELANVSPLTHLEVNEQIGVPESVMTSLMTAELSRCRQAST
jgi:acetyl esterase/lipase